MKKLKSINELIPIIRKLQNQGKKVVFTNGCFDILHIGHVKYLKAAKKFGDFLVVGLNSDKSVRKIKGSMRPIYPQSERAEILGSLECVDFISIFDETTPLNIIKKVKPNVLVKGGDYELNEIVGRDFVESIGGKTISISLVKNKSSSNIIKKISSIKVS